MKAKTLLVAAAALAAATISSQAQVYSQNIVGYVNVKTLAGQQTLVCNPFNLDGVNNITNVLAGAPKGVTCQLWNGAGYTLIGRATLGAGLWSANAATNFIPPGVGFFLKTPTDFTNTFVGSVVPGSPGTNSFNLPAGVLQLVGSTLPVSGTITNAADQGVGTLNLGFLPPGSQIQLWNGAGFTLVGRATLGAKLWNTNPVINVAQGFFLKSPSATNWVQSLP